jgi:hypothetical protein
MTQYNFEAYDPDEQSTITKEFQAVSLDTILQEFQYFLKGAGFEFNGNIEVVPEETTETQSFDEWGSWGNEDVNYTGGGIDFDSMYNEVDTPTDPMSSVKTSEGL